MYSPILVLVINDKVLKASARFFFSIIILLYFIYLFPIYFQALCRAHSSRPICIFVVVVVVGRNLLSFFLIFFFRILSLSKVAECDTSIAIIQNRF